MKKILFILLLFPCWVFAQQAQPVNPVQVPQTTLYNEPSTGTRWWYNGATLGWYPLFPYSPPNTVLTGLSMSVVSSTLTVHTGTWRINNQVYTLGSNTNFTLQARDSVYSRYETVYATGVNNGIGIKVGVLSPTPIQPSVGADTLIVGAVLITPTQTTIIPPGPANEFVFSQPTVQQSYAKPWIRTLTSDTIKVGGHYILPPIDGTSGQVIQTDGAGNLFWSNQAIYLPLYPITISANNIGADTTGSTRGLVTHSALLDTLRKNAAHFNPTQFTIANDTISLLHPGGGGSDSTLYKVDDSIHNTDRVVSQKLHSLTFDSKSSVGIAQLLSSGTNISAFVADTVNSISSNLILNQTSSQMLAYDASSDNAQFFVGITALPDQMNASMQVNDGNTANQKSISMDLHTSNNGIYVTDLIDSLGLKYTSSASYKYGATDTLWIPNSGWVQRYVAAHGGSGTVTSITPGVGFLSHTPITTSGTMNIDSASTIVTKTFAGRYVTNSSTTAFTNKTGNISQWTNDSGYITSASVPVAANPTASVGGSPVNGSATTFMRSDAAPKADTSVLQTVLNLFPKTDTRYKHDFTIAGHSIASNFNTTLATLSYGYGIALQSGTSTYDASGGSTFRVDTGTTIQTVANFFPKGDTRYLKTSSAPTGANPTATAGTSAVNGSATTFMRSDAAPKVDSAAFRTVANSYSLSGLQTKFNGYVPTSTTVAGFALSSNVTLAALTATDATLTFSGSYTGATARTVGLNLGNANTWTAAQTYQINNITTTKTDALYLQNNTASTSGAARQISPSLHFGARVWNTTATAADNWADWVQFADVASSGTPTTTLTWASSRTTTSTPSYTNRMTLDNSGNLNITNSVTSPNITATSQINGLYVYANGAGGTGGLAINGNNYGLIQNTTASTDAWQIGYGSTPTSLGTAVINWTPTAITFQQSPTIALGKELKVTEGTNGFAGQTTLVSGTKAITITGVTTSSRAFVTLVSQGGTVTTTQVYAAVCTANTLTITALTNAGATDATDTSVLNYFIVN